MFTLYQKNMKTNKLAQAGIALSLFISINAFAQNPAIKKDALKGKVWKASKENEKKAAHQTYLDDGVFVNGGAMIKGKWSWKNDSVLDLKFSGVSWEQKVIKLTDTEYVMEMKGVTYTFTPKN